MDVLHLYLDKDGENGFSDSQTHHSFTVADGDTQVHYSDDNASYHVVTLKGITEEIDYGDLTFYADVI